MMRDERRVVTLDPIQQGVLLTALNDFRNGRLKEGKSATLAADLIADLYAAPTRKARVRDEAR